MAQHSNSYISDFQRQSRGQELREETIERKALFSEVLGKLEKCSSLFKNHDALYNKTKTYEKRISNGKAETGCSSVKVFVKLEEEKNPFKIDISYER